MGPANNKKLGRDLRSLLKSEVLTDTASLALYSTDASIYQIMPGAVVLPKDTEDVVKTVRYAAEQRIGVSARGGGSGLAGECLCAGIVLDMTKYMRNFSRLAAGQSSVEAQPGVVLGVLNQQAGKYGKLFGPDPSSADRATVGGVIANNSTGAHFMVYGYTGEHVQSLELVLSDGQVVRIDRQPSGQALGGNGRLKRIRKDLAELGNAHAKAIVENWPRIKRNRSGYNLSSLAKGEGLDLISVLAGSEGTLGIITSARLGLVEVPKVKVLLQLNFASMELAVRAVPHIVRQRVSTCEIMDGRIIEQARQAYPEWQGQLPVCGASLLVEHSGENLPQVMDLAEGTRKLVVEELRLTDRAQMIVDPTEQKQTWHARKESVPLLFRGRDRKKAIECIEDVAVPIDRLEEYAGSVEEIAHKEGLSVAHYGHAGDGLIHIRPFFDLHDPQDVAKLRAITQRVFELAWSLGGTMSGEHGDGRLRSQFLPGQYGQFYGLFEQVKRIFDPDNILNPGNIIVPAGAEIMTKNLRYRPAVNREGFSDEQLAELEACNGCGSCRSLTDSVEMCPVFRALGDEAASPRGKANLLSAALLGVINPKLAEAEFARLGELCLDCRLCKGDCPSGVDVAGLIRASRARYVQSEGLEWSKWLLTRAEGLSRLGSLGGPVANLATKGRAVRWVMEKFTGMDRRRGLPRFGWKSVLRRLQQRASQDVNVDGPRAGRAAYFVDIFGTYHDHELAEAVVDLLQHNDVEVIIPPQRAAGTPAISHGDLDYAASVAQYNVTHLVQAVREGYTVVCSEPSAAVSLKEDYPDLLGVAEAREVAENAVELGDYLRELYRRGQLKGDLKPLPDSLALLAYHRPCHLKNLGTGEAFLELLGLIPAVEIERLPHSCCGLAGTFGMRRKNFALSMAIGKQLMQALAESPAKAGVTECSTCKMQLELGSGKSVWHPAKILAKSYGLGAKGSKS